MNIYSKLNKSLSQIFQVNYNPQLDYFELQLETNNFTPWNKGEKNVYSKETLKLMSNSAKGNKKRLGKKFTEESLQKMRKSAFKRDHSHLNKKVLTPDGTFNSLTEAANHYNKSRSWVTKQLKTKHFKVAI